LKITCLLVEDEKLAREELEYLIGKSDDFKVSFTASNSQQALEIINQAEIEVVFLDINIPGISGIELAKEINQKEAAPLIVFTTAFDDYAIEAFKLSAVDYLLKPISEARLEQSLQKIKKQLKQKINYNQKLANLLANFPEQKNNKQENLLNKIAVVEKNYYLMLNFTDIYYFSTQDKKVWAHCQKKSYMTQFQLKELEEILPGQFFKIHKSYIVNLKHIKAVIPWFKGKYQVLMADYSGHKIPVSRSKVEKINKLLNLK
jgi:two-component system LytT family response regulator/two-component system response regulator LytT